ncbi:MAG TPA: glycosyltransferase, partial [Candidatus Methanomethylicus sp.]|nr:glycosyltransferase [Candidatus Methanomethylicus sp.]
MIRYVHNPIMHRLREVERKGAFWSAYRRPYEIISRRIPENCILLANSNFTSSRIKEEWGRDASVLYPPVELKTPGDKVRQVVSVGRFSFEKRYEEVVQLAKTMPAMKFIICGALYDRAYYEKIAAQAVGRENILLMPDVPDADLEILLAKSRFFLHAMRNEDFGIAIVEAMSCGCIPVVHRSGGPKEIVGDDTLTFSEIKEVPSIISSIAGREDEISTTMMRKASEFSYANFVSRAEQEMKKVLG